MREEDLITCNCCGNEYSVSSDCRYCNEDETPTDFDKEIKEYDKELKDDGYSKAERDKLIYEYIQNCG
jgi:hypothetical protein